MLFNSKEDPIPELRRDLEIIPIEEENNSYLYFLDPRKYTPDNFALDRRVAPILSLLGGGQSIRDLEPHLSEEVTEDDLLEYVRFLDRNRLLHSEHLSEHARQIEETYEASDVHHSITAGNSFPEEPEKLRSYLKTLFEEHAPELQEQAGNESARALYAPHIDPRVGIKGYVKAFAPLRTIAPSRVVILATSHYGSLYPDLYDNRPFVLSDKDFSMPLGTIPSDRATVEELSKLDGAGISTHDRAHRIEHSIEMHLLFTSYLWDHEYQIVPILVNGFEDLYYMQEAHLATQVERFSSYLRDRFGEDEDTFFLISGDLAHVGKKFGDEQPAREMMSEIKSFDRMFLNHASNANSQELLNLVKEEYDPYRICGFPPLYTFLNGFSDLSGETLSYDIWDESERESAVSFGSLLYR